MIINLALSITSSQDSDTAFVVVMGYPHEGDKHLPPITLLEAHTQVPPVKDFVSVESYALNTVARALNEWMEVLKGEIYQSIDDLMLRFAEDKQC